MVSIITDPYLLAHTVGLASQVIIILYVLIDMVRTREKRLLLSFGIFLTFALVELSLILYYLRNGSIFDIHAESTVDVFTWMLALSFLLLSSAAVATLAVYLLEYKTLYLVPIFSFILTFYDMFYTYYLFRPIFLEYIRSLAVVRIAAFIAGFTIFIVALAGEVLFALIYRRTKSLRVLTFIIGTTFAGFINIGGIFLLEFGPTTLSMAGLLPNSLAEQIVGFYGVYKTLLEEWPLNALYILIYLLFLLGQTNLLDALARFRRLRGRAQKAWIERMLEEA